jgi:hypothetical protein
MIIRNRIFTERINPIIMQLKTIKLSPDLYHEFLEGKEVVCQSDRLSSKDIAVGEHVMIFKDSASAETNVSPPRREMQSEYIGIEGSVLSIPRPEEMGKNVFRIRRI